RAHLFFVVAERVVESQDRNPPLVLPHRIKIDLILIAGENLAEASHADICAGPIANRLLVCRTEPRSLLRPGRKHPVAGLALETVAAKEVRVPVGQVSESRDIKAAGPPVVDRLGL